MRAMILPSVDCQDYVLVVLLADTQDEQQVKEQIRKGLLNVKRSNPEGWCYEEIRKELEHIVVIASEVLIGPVWDE
jgi:hypothetical protein